MKSTNWIIAVIPVLFVVLAIGLGVVAMALLLRPDEQAVLLQIIERHRVLVFFGILVIFGVLGGGAAWLYRRYLEPMDRLPGEIRLIFAANPAYRLDEKGGRMLHDIHRAVNEGAERFERQLEGVQEQMAHARRELEEEKNILETIIGQVVEGIVVCRLDGQILLYNNVARQLLAGAERDRADSEAGFVGLGRSVFGVIDRHLIIHALDEIAHRLEAGTDPVTSQFVTGRGKRLLRVNAFPVVGERQALTGFVLVIYDVTERVELDSRRNQLLQTLTEEMRADVASLRAAIETLRSYTDLDPEQVEAFEQVIHEKALRMSERLDRTADEYSRLQKAPWTQEVMMAADLLQTIKRKGERVLGVDVQLRRDVSGPTWLKVDGYAVVQALLFLIDVVQKETGVTSFTLRSSRHEGFLITDIVWEGRPQTPEMLRDWLERGVVVRGERLPYTLGMVIERHSAEIWVASGEEGTGYVRVLWPVVDEADMEHGWQTQPYHESRPIFYDFNLFARAEPCPEAADRLLTELTYTVFDTETTGLNPSEGDEIIAIGAVRIVNGRVLRDEVFEQLVDPRRPLSLQSVRIHGIRPEMLKGQPTIEDVLPRFHRFAEGTVLVAHNAAFDMRFLQLKEKQTGVRFRNHVLDTLLLSAVVQPGVEDHSLDAIAERLGVEAVGRHTALGDAITTAEVFLKLLPLLTEQGVETLRDALEASQRTAYARMQY